MRRGGFCRGDRRGRDPVADPSRRVAAARAARRAWLAAGERVADPVESRLSFEISDSGDILGVG